jgi:hypothetical protein
VKLIGRRPIDDPAELARVVAGCFAHLEAGLTRLERPASAGEIAVELAGVDAGGRLVLVLCDLVAEPAAVLRALEAAAWWREHAGLADRVFGDVVVDTQAAPRTFVVATRWSDRALRVLGTLAPLGALGPVAVECRVFLDAEGAELVSLDRFDAARAAADAPARRALQPEPAPHDAPAPRPAPAEAGAPARAAGDGEKQRAAVLIERLERLRFSEVFR